jgi:hypothetical protein
MLYNYLGVSLALFITHARFNYDPLSFIFFGTSKHDSFLKSNPYNGTQKSLFEISAGALLKLIALTYFPGSYIVPIFNLIMKSIGV